MKRANEFGTKVTCESSAVTEGIQKAFLAAQTAVRSGNTAEVEKARNAVQKWLVINFMQATITYAHEMYLDREAKIPADEHQVEAYSFYRTIAPIIAQANATGAAALDYYLFPGQPVPKNVDLGAVRALGTTFQKLGLTGKDIGQYGRKQPDLGCKAYVPAPSAGGLLSSTDAKDSLRPTGAPAAGAAAAAPKPAAAAAAPKPGARRLHNFWFL